MIKDTLISDSAISECEYCNFCKKNVDRIRLHTYAVREIMPSEYIHICTCVLYVREKKNLSTSLQLINVKANSFL